MASKSDDLPKGWSRHESSSRPGKFYYMNKYTGETKWRKPKEEATKQKTKTKKRSYVFSSFFTHSSSLHFFEISNLHIYESSIALVTHLLSYMLTDNDCVYYRNARKLKNDRF